MLTGTDPDETRALVDDFLASAADDLAALAAARASTAWVQLAGAAGQLEAAGRAGERPALAALAADVATAADRLRLCAAERYPG